MEIKNAKFWMTVLGASAFGIAVSAGVYSFLHNSPMELVEDADTISEKNNVHFASNSYEGLPDFRAAAKTSTQAVVHIKTYKNYDPNEDMMYVDPFEDLMKDFFGDQYPQRGQRQVPQKKDEGPRPMGSGSGVILTADGYIATNNHVIKGADKIEVVLNDKRKFEAKLIGFDPATDLALLKIEESNLPFLPYGNSDEIEVGEWVLAVGNPFDLNSTVTAGIVSAKARNINILKDKENLAIESFIQTDAAVNPGNSGGALVNLKGELVGINTAIASPTGAYAGYAFAVPVTLVKKVMDDLLKFGEVQRALLGVSIKDIDDELAKELKLDNIKGVYVAEVRSGSSAESAGIKPKDIIVTINGNQVNSSSELQEQVARFSPGDEINIGYIRDGKTYTTKTQLKNKLGTTNVVKKGEKAIAEVLGAKMQQITSEVASDLKVKSGVEVVEPGVGAIKNAGIRKGFVITHVNRQPIASPDEVMYGITSVDEPSVVKGVYPNGEVAFYMVKP